MFIGTLARSWAGTRLVGAAELLLFDGDRVLQAHWSEGHWRTISWNQ